jgi:hypothetical protein
MWLDRLWVLGRKNDRWHLRFYPNPGFCATVAGRQVKWSRKYGWKVRVA